MTELANDPIIAFYIRLSNSSNPEDDLPMYSEIMLRLSFKEVFGGMRPLRPEDMELYRKLVLFYYAETFSSMTDLATIMSCYSKSEILGHFGNYDETMMQWGRFVRKNLTAFIYKEAVVEMILEYRRRHLLIYGYHDDGAVRDKAEEVIQFFRVDFKMRKRWLKSLHALLRSREKDMPPPPPPLSTTANGRPDNRRQYNAADLEMMTIYQDVKSRLNPFVIDDDYSSCPVTLQMHDGDDSVNVDHPPAKRSKDDVLKTLDIQIIVPEDTDDADLDMDAVFKGKYNEAGATGEASSSRSSARLDGISVVNIDASDGDGDGGGGGGGGRGGGGGGGSVAEVSVIKQEHYDSTTTSNECEEDEEEVEEEDEDEEEEESDSMMSESTLSQLPRQQPGPSPQNQQDQDQEQQEQQQQQHRHRQPQQQQQKGNIINKETAFNYLSALQAYAVVNSYFDAISLLDKVDSIFRKNTTTTTTTTK